MNTVLYKLCLHCVSIMDGWLPYPSTALSKVCGMSLYKTRKELKKLKEQGLIESCIHISDDEEFFILRGYTITEKGRKTKEYEKAWQKKKKFVWSVLALILEGRKNE